MNVDIILNDQLWSAIAENYQNGNYAGAITDAIFFLCRTIRDKSGLEHDGVALVGAALGGKDPPLKLTKMQTQSDKDEQAGFEQLARGLIQGIRNPRSHEKRVDTREDANAIIGFIDHLLRRIHQATVPFEVASFVKRVFDQDFVYSERYATLLIEEIPPNRLTDVLYDIYAQKDIGKPTNVGLFLSTLMLHLKDDDKTAFVKAVSQEMKNTGSEAAIRAIVSIFHSKNWTMLEESAKLRIENKILKSVSEGKYSVTSGSFTSGALGTWATIIAEGMQLQDKLLSILAGRLNSSDRHEQDYVFKQFSSVLFNLQSPSSSLIRVLKTGLQKGDQRFYDLVSYEMTSSKDEWISQIKADFESFTVKPVEDVFEDEIPF